jgi:hypothetical protein
MCGCWCVCVTGRRWPAARFSSSAQSLLPVLATWAGSLSCKGERASSQVSRSSAPLVLLHASLPSVGEGFHVMPSSSFFYYSLPFSCLNPSAYLCGVVRAMMMSRCVQPSWHWHGMAVSFVNALAKQRHYADAGTGRRGLDGTAATSR